jgi:DNA-binding SARP family transcriptional activator/tetratricopeptide (TPR) repeat protein/TolB-like protein
MVMGPITLRLLGTPVLHLAGGTTVELRQKAYVLAALLHLEYQGRVRRSTVAERLWETSTGEQAMNNLRQTLLQTRRLEEQFGFRLFKSDSTHVELDPSITVDLRELGRVRMAKSGSELATLVQHYRGELLGDAGDLGPELAHWRQTERARIEHQFATHASEAALRIGGRESLAALDDLSTRMPLSEEVCRAQLRLLLLAGNTTGARALLDTFAGRMIHELGIGPAPETIALLDPPEPERPSATIHQLSEVRARNEPVPQRLPFVPRVVLLPPMQENKQGGMRKHLAPALIDDVTIRLTRLRSVSVIAPHTAWSLDPFSALDDARSHQIDYAVESRVAPDFASEAMTIGIRLVRTATREIVWADKFAFNLGATPEVYWDFANGIARALADNIEASELAHERTLRDANAYVHYLDGRHHLRSFDLPKVRRGRKSLRMARDIDPGQASIESALARSYVVEWVLRAGSDRSLLDKARLHAERAVAIDPNDGTAYRELGRAALFDRDLDLSLEHMERAAQLAPHHADVLADYADTLVHNSQHVAAQEKIEEALRLNPMPPDEYHWTFAGVSFLRGRFEEALGHLNQMRNPEPAMRLMAAAAAMAGQPELARKSRMQVLEQQPDFSITRWVGRMPQRSPNDVELYIEALRRAGFK